MNEPSPTVHAKNQSAAISQPPVAHSMRSRRTPTWARPRNSDDGYSRCCCCSSLHRPIGFIICRIYNFMHCRPLSLNSAACLVKPNPLLNEDLCCETLAWLNIRSSHYSHGWSFLYYFGFPCPWKVLVFIFCCHTAVIQYYDTHLVISRRWANVFLYLLLAELPDQRYEKFFV